MKYIDLITPKPGQFVMGEGMEISNLAQSFFADRFKNKRFTLSVLGGKVETKLLGWKFGQYGWLIFLVSHPKVSNLVETPVSSLKDVYWLVTPANKPETVFLCTIHSLIWKDITEYNDVENYSANELLSFPHKCIDCQGPAYIGAVPTAVTCSVLGCKRFKSFRQQE